MGNQIVHNKGALLPQLCVLILPLEDNTNIFKLFKQSPHLAQSFEYLYLQVSYIEPFTITRKITLLPSLFNN